MRSLVASVILLMVALAAFAAATDGFQVATSESARRLQVLRSPSPLPDAALGFADGRRTRLHADLAADGRIVVLDFIYTRCETLCTALGSDFQRLQREIRARGLENRVRLLSLSFDPVHDTPPVLAERARWLRADSALWQFASVPDARELQDLLRAAGIVVIADGLGGYVHNAALHVVAPDARLVRIRDLGEVDQVLHDAARATP